MIALGVAVLLYHKKHYRSFGIWTVALALLFYLAPVKIDGTESKSAHKAEVSQRTAEYSDVSSSVQPVVTTKKSFAERMAEEDTRAARLNKAIQDDI